jgi:hypothetical protein
MTDLRKSINSIINERLSSPFYGTLILSWLVWNWKIVYLTFFVSESKIEGNKIDFILSKYSEIDHLVYFPLVSTAVLLTVIPFISNGAYWLNLKFNIWKSDKKNEIERKQLLTLEQSIQLRELIADQEKRFENILSDKNSEIQQLKLQLDGYTKQNNNITPKPTSKPTPQTESSLKRIQILANKIKENANLTKAFTVINYHIQGGYTGLIDAEGITTDILSFFESNDIIENKGKGMYGLTETGKKVNRALTNLKFE